MNVQKKKPKRTVEIASCFFFNYVLLSILFSAISPKKFYGVRQFKTIPSS